MIAEPFAVIVPPQLDPASGFLAVEMSPGLSRFTLNGKPVLRIHNGETWQEIPPQLDEITIYPLEGKIVFNTANAGQTFVGDPYYWVSN